MAVIKRLRYDLKYKVWDNFIEEKKPRIFWWWATRIMDMEWPFVRPPKQRYGYEGASEHRRDIGGRGYFSQAGQDLFVLDMLENKQSGTYVEIGGADPYESNNTFLLESEADWFGISVEYDSGLAAKYNEARRGICFQADATQFDYKSEIAKRLGDVTRVDYLSADIDPAENTFKALQQLPLGEIRFSVITYEHDNYESGPEYMGKSRKYLESFGYVLVASNVNCFGRDFEDWWIDPQVIPEKLWKPYSSQGKEFSEIFGK